MLARRLRWSCGAIHSCPFCPQEGGVQLSEAGDPVPGRGEEPGEEPPAGVSPGRRLSRPAGLSAAVPHTSCDLHRQPGPPSEPPGRTERRSPTYLL